MVKLLIAGDINGQWESLITRITTLNQSNHGPFHMLIIAGNTTLNDIHELCEISSVFPIPTYIYNYHG